MRTFEKISFSSNSRSWGTARSRWKRAFSATFDMTMDELQMCYWVSVAGEGCVGAVLINVG